MEMEIGEKDEDVFTQEGREKLLEDAEISAKEDAFMRGEEEARNSIRKDEEE